MLMNFHNITIDIDLIWVQYYNWQINVTQVTKTFSFKTDSAFKLLMFNAH